ncbi:MAG TPA: folylpolyglutamate synthase/dihydrofolate synthase family protein [Actinomycetota bacterium]|nr:folylpolyglutamate synthase/dihydrofolate synthase family protein [Actinomycetota bacterium]
MNHWNFERSWQLNSKNSTEMDAYRRAIKALDRRGFGIRPGLDRVRALLELLDDPQKSYPSIHVAGTNGKTTTSRIIGALLAAHGCSVGTYTSPHLQSVRERFERLGSAEEGIVADLIEPEEFALLHEYLGPFIATIENERGETVTYFEVLTAMAFDWMAQQAVGAGVFETGLGGRWDATNVLEPQVCVLTNIDVDHAIFLGSTPVENAREKAGIIKPGTVVVSAQQDPEVDPVITEAALREGAELHRMQDSFEILSDDVAEGGRITTVRGLHSTYEDLFLPLMGQHQSRNLAVSIAAVEAFFGRQLDPEATRAALLQVRSPGRMEIVRLHPVVMLDGAHNPDGAATLAGAIKTSFPGRHTTLVLSIMSDKDREGILERILPLADSVIFTRCEGPRASDPRDLASIASKLGHASSVVPSLREAIDAAIDQSGHEDLVLMTGSLYAVGEARDHLVGPIE